MNNHTRDLSLIAMFSALLIGVQVALSFVAGVELVTATLVIFAAVFGIKRGMAVAVVFSLLRCIIWGFFPNVVVLYLIYFPLLALFSALCGKIKDFDWRYVVTVIVAVVMTICFTLLDDVITPLISGFNRNAWRAYFYAGTPTMVAQSICAAVTLLIMYPPLFKLLDKMKTKYFLSQNF